jgi:choline dehydrogenase-like flavoprotein
MTENLDTDVIIIGSGVAGAICAWALARKGIKVTILEAGPRIERQKIVASFRDSPNQDLSAGFPNAPWAPRPDWSHGHDRYIEQIGPVPLEVEYLRVVGGTTWHWAGIAIRPLPVEFRMRSSYDVGVDWPMSYEDLEPFYSQAETELGVAGDDTVNYGSPRSRPHPLPPIPPSYSDKFIANRLRGAGIHFIARPVARNSLPYAGRVQCQGYGTCSPICPSGAQYCAMVHVEKAEQLGVQVLENSRVDRLQTDTDGRITTVEFARSDGSTGTAKGRVVALAANGIENPRLLLMSASDSHPQGLANRSGTVGRYLMDHPGIYCSMLVTPLLYAGRGPGTIITSFTHRDGSFRRQRAAWALSVYNDLHLHEITNRSLTEQLLPPTLDEIIRYRAMHQVGIDICMEVLPSADNGITLDWSRRDSAGQPVIRLEYTYGDYEQAGFEAARKIFWSASAALGAQETTISEPYSNHHMMGMTRMGINPDTSVVDAECRTHDHRNLFVLGSSVFPTSGTANPTLTIAALSLRAADSISAQLSGK